jgi:hypothetical protein
MGLEYMGSRRRPLHEPYELAGKRCSRSLTRSWYVSRSEVMVVAMELKGGEWDWSTWEVDVDRFTNPTSCRVNTA